MSNPAEAGLRLMPLCKKSRWDIISKEVVEATLYLQSYENLYTFQQTGQCSYDECVVGPIIMRTAYHTSLL